jgi:translation initiation factor 2 beta subunit (eIF-2beta)/eIF-5
MNIDASDDFFYRYKMPVLEINNYGKGNGKFTNLVNITEICNSINTPLKILMVYLTQSLGTNYKETSLNGHYSKDELINLIIKFNKEFILCQKCNIPELTPTIEGKKKNIKLIYSCSACGEIYEKESNSKINSKTLDAIINYYKVNTFIKTNGNI